MNTAIARDLISAFDQYEFPVLNSSISQRVAFAEAAAVGLTVFETPARTVAGPEISALAKEILSLQQKRKAA